ncbi:Uma2 family endonuclease [Oscillatoria salina]|uniref:Uma2 family endonuclease n=1 Tax=Oscillatoria salina TaxID=331517 RepID=UPI0013BC4954|nr:Uma2 family endonuclease [Oscillatoria salina]MBZ8178513.1 Uma2 family endonuclease [Oscillatoria salina IIICB1]NET86877.1 Uma2 family endonuclease [Kamptonema sp. SIO1D9]
MVTTSLILNLDAVHLTDEQFYQLCQNNRDLKFEKTSNGELIVMPPTGGNTGRYNLKITQQLANWSDLDRTGVAFDSSTGFQLPNGAYRSPDAAWISLAKWNRLSPEQQDKFPPICPDFVIELRSPSDSLKSLQEKMQEYLDNGTLLGWLINRQNREVEIYRFRQAKELLNSPRTLSGEDILPNFVLNLEAIWR